MICFRIVIAIILLSFCRVYSQPSARNLKIDSLKKVIEAKKGDLKTLQEFVRIFNYENDTLKKEMDAWMRQYPDSSSFPWAMGSGLARMESPEALPYLKKAAELAPSNPEIWSALALDAEFRGENALARQYKKKAADVAPGNVDMQYRYALSIREVNKEEWIKKMIEVADRFRNETRGAAVLSMLGYYLTDPDEKIKAYEKCRVDFPPAKNLYSAVAMFRLIDLYLRKGFFDKAIALSDTLRTVREYQRLQFEARFLLASEMKTIQKLLEEKKYEEAIGKAEKLKAPSNFNGGNLIHLMKARIYAGAGMPKRAYDSLIMVQSTRPDDLVADAINLYGKLLGKDKRQQTSDIREKRISASRSAVPFELERYSDDSRFKLTDHKGKVVLLTFWFPGCGPCRAEMPFFESVLKSINRKDVLYVGINSVRSQDAFVDSFLKNNKFTFIPLKGTKEVSTEYHVVANPANFLIDKEGRVAYSNFMIDGDNERTLELMFQSLLE